MRLEGRAPHGIVGARHAWPLQCRALSRRSALGRLGAAALVAAQAAVLEACSGSGGKKAATSGGSGQPPGKPSYGGALNAADGADLFDFDPTVQPSANRDAIGMAYDSLLGLKAGPGVGYTDIVLEPRLAQRWEQPDARTFTFHLQPGITFAGLPPVNGRQVSSADARWSYEYLSRSGQFKDNAKLPPTPDDFIFSGLDRIETPDDLTMTVRFNAPFTPFLSYAAQDWIVVVPHEIYDQAGSFSKQMVGTGPWQLDSADSQKGVRWTFKKNAHYFLSGRPYIDQISYLVLADEVTQHAAFTAKQLDVLNYAFVSADSLPQLKKDNPSAVVYDFLGTDGGHLLENTTKPPLGDERLRKAIALCIDHDEFMKLFGGGKGEWAPAASLPGLFSEQELKQMLVYDPAQAKQLLSAAGYANGLDLELIYPMGRGGDLEARLQLLQAQLKKGNINVSLKVVERATEGNRRRVGDFQLGILTSTAEGDLDSEIYKYYFSTSPNNYTKINDPELDRLILAQRSEPDSAKRRELWRQVVRRINDRSWAAGFFFAHNYDLWQARLKNFAPNFAHRAQPLLNSWVDR